jgi:hypothetical protein
MIAALYVETGGVYFGLPDVDPWDEQRDARLYRGPWPVVAHPPCAAWSKLAGLREYVHGLPRGEDGGCFEHALWSVRKFGGVLEHPASSSAWARFRLPRPIAGQWSQSLLRPGEWVCQVAQSAYGHRARKLTWLCYNGPRPAELDWSSPAGTMRVSDANGARQGKPCLSKRERSSTPISFRDMLLDLAWRSA